MFVGSDTFYTEVWAIDDVKHYQFGPWTKIIANIELMGFWTLSIVRILKN
jgi:hypothetical protein